MRHFYSTLAEFGDRAALVGPTGHISYSDLHDAAVRFAGRIGPARSLVFLEARNEIDSIAAYLGCLLADHPVYLFNPHDKNKAEALAERYRPNAVVRFDDGRVIIDGRHRETLDLHPDLKILLATSGSTGSPRLVKLSGRNVQANADSIVEYLQLDGAERAATSLRFNYSFGMSVLHSHLTCGASLLLTDRSVTDKEFWTLLGRHSATSFSGVPHTFELLQRLEIDWSLLPSLRHVAQAGGRLSPELVKSVATIGEKHGWRFYVMYGQTEAAPRIAYLPPEHVREFPHCIGVPVPGGTLTILDDAGESIHEPHQPGELAYAGPNVMMGYADAVGDLSTDDTPPVLRTGDIGCRNEVGLYYIVGRRSRFVKPFGIRVNLEDVQNEVRKVVFDAAVTGTDERVVIAAPLQTASDTEALVIDRLAGLYRLPADIFRMVRFEHIPRFDSGKVDYQAVLQHASLSRSQALSARPAITPGSFVATVFSKSYLQRTFWEARKILGLTAGEWTSVRQIFEVLVGAVAIDDCATFRSLGGDSLSYVQVQVALDDYLGRVPEGWESMTVTELEGANTRVASL